MTEINLDKLAEDNNYDVKVSIESSKNSTERNQDFILRIIFSIALVVVIGWCLHTLSNNKASSQAQEVAQTTLSALIGGIAGYVLGRTEKK